MLDIFLCSCMQLHNLDPHRQRGLQDRICRPYSHLKNNGESRHTHRESAHRDYTSVIYPPRLAPVRAQLGGSSDCCAARQSYDFGHDQEKRSDTPPHFLQRPMPQGRACQEKPRGRNDTASAQHMAYSIPELQCERAAYGRDGQRRYRMPSPSAQSARRPPAVLRMLCPDSCAGRVIGKVSPSL